MMVIIMMPRSLGNKQSHDGTAEDSHNDLQGKSKRYSVSENVNQRRLNVLMLHSD